MLRRNFLKNGCKLCIGIAGGSAMISLIQSCTPLPIYKTVSVNKKITVDKNQFLETSYLIVSASNLNYDIAVIKKSETEYQSYIMQCTHADNPLRFNGKEFRCNLHGSIFNTSGGVEVGPAEKPLSPLTTTLESNLLTINLI